MIEKSSVSLERTVLVGIITLNQPKHVLEEYLNELNFSNLYRWRNRNKKIYTENEFPRS